MQNADAKGTTARKVQVHRFYEVLWNARDLDAIPSVLHDDFTFRGSLGDEKRGHNGFAAYVNKVHAALGDYRCTVEVLEPPARLIQVVSGLLAPGSQASGSSALMARRNGRRRGWRRDMPVTRTCPGNFRNVLGASPRCLYTCGPGAPRMK